MLGQPSAIDKLTNVSQALHINTTEHVLLSQQIIPDSETLHAIDSPLLHKPTVAVNPELFRTTLYCLIKVRTTTYVMLRTRLSGED